MHLLACNGQNAAEDVAPGTPLANLAMGVQLQNDFALNPSPFTPLSAFLGGHTSAPLPSQHHTKDSAPRAICIEEFLARAEELKQRATRLWYEELHELKRGIELDIIKSPAQQCGDASPQASPTARPGFPDTLASPMSASTLLFAAAMSPQQAATASMPVPACSPAAADLLISGWSPALASPPARFIRRNLTSSLANYTHHSHVEDRPPESPTLPFVRQQHLAWQQQQEPLQSEPTLQQEMLAWQDVLQPESQQGADALQQHGPQPHAHAPMRQRAPAWQQQQQQEQEQAQQQEQEQEQEQQQVMQQEKGQLEPDAPKQQPQQPLAPPPPAPQALKRQAAAQQRQAQQQSQRKRRR